MTTPTTKPRLGRSIGVSGQRLHHASDILFPATLVTRGQRIAAKLGGVPLCTARQMGATQVVAISTAALPNKSISPSSICLPGKAGISPHLQPTVARLKRLERAAPADPADYTRRTACLPQRENVMLANMANWRTTYHAPAAALLA
jgi:hypothetical protein